MRGYLDPQHILPILIAVMVAQHLKILVYTEVLLNCPDTNFIPGAFKALAYGL